MSTIDTRRALDRAADDLLTVAMSIEGIEAGLLALASDMDGIRTVSPIQATRLCELLAGACRDAVHRLSIAHGLLEAVERQEGADDTP